MELFFILLCISIAVVVIAYASSAANNESPNKKTISRTCLVFAVLLAIISVWMLCNVGGETYSKAEMCSACGGDGITVSGKRCGICHGAGGAVVTKTSTKIPFIYVFGTGMVALSLFIGAVCCTDSSTQSAAVDTPVAAPKPLSEYAIKVKLFDTSGSEGTVGFFVMKYVFTDDDTKEVLGRGIQFDVVTLNVDKPTKIRCHVGRGFQDAILDYVPRHNAMYNVIPDVDTGLHFQEAKFIK